MLLRRRLYHCARCLYAESSNRSKGPALLRPLDPHSTSSYKVPSSSRVRLSPDSIPKLPARKWSRNTASSNQSTRLGDKQTLEDIRQTALERRYQRMNLRQKVLPPVPAPRDAIHCVILNIPPTFLSSDVKRLVPFDPTIRKHHPVTKVTRIYNEHLIPLPYFLLRFSTPKDLQGFLRQTPNLKVFGRPIEVRIFQRDMDPSCVRPRTLLFKHINPKNILLYRRRYIRDSIGKSKVVMVDGIPSFCSLPLVAYTMRIVHKKDRFEWAHKWISRPGHTVHFEPNAVPILGTMSSVKTWVFMLKDVEAAWSFARRLHLTYFREDKYGATFLLRTSVLD